MREIMMSGVLPRLILDGHKTQTRRAGKRWEKMRVGDVLHVREAWARVNGELIFRADDRSVHTPIWTPAVHMPLELCRCRIRVTGIRREVLGSISEFDAVAEGFRAMKTRDLLMSFSGGKVLKMLGETDWLQAVQWWGEASARDRFLLFARLLMGEEALKQECTVIEFEVVR
jgi:hypothetical protein